MASNETHKFPWMVKQEQIDRFFDFVEGHRVSAAIIQGPPACGKSTTMLAHLFAQAQDKVSGAPVAYILPSSLEAVLLAKYILSEDFNKQLPVAMPNNIVTAPPEDYALPGGHLLVTRYKQILEWFWDNDKRFPFGNRAVVMMDIEMNPTTDGEILLGHILDWASSCYKTENPAAAVVLTSTFASPRTEWILDYIIGRQPDVITIPTDAVPAINLHPMGEAWQTAVEQMVNTAADLESPQGRQIIFGIRSMMDMMSEKGIKLLNGNDPLDHTLALTKSQPSLVLGEGLDFSLFCKGLRTFVSEGTINEQHLDRSICQVVICTRYKSKLEILREKSWLLKSGVPRENVVFYTTFSHNEFERFSDSESTGSAYNGDISWTMLQRVAEWPSIPLNSMPVRRASDAAVAAEYMYRLSVLSCVTPSGEGHAVTQKGELAVLLKRHTLQDLDFRVAIFVASAHIHRGHRRPNAMRVIIRLAALLQVGLHTVCHKVGDPQRPPALEEVRQMCRGVGASLVQKGALWIALGLWQATVWQGRESLRSYLTDGAFRMDYPAEWLVLNISAMDKVQHIVAALEKVFKVPGFEDGQELSATELTADEITFIERELVSAFRHNLVVIPKENKSSLFDAVSLKNVRIGEGEIIDAQKEYQKGEAPHVAIYSHLSVKGNRYLAHDITIVPNYLISEVEEHTGASIRESIASTITT
ncbi:uncharacterized protein F4812DRAFT_469728 [Daldinia caldariorum]|uniref:uncharacterized protein n=1 Tax=Daldinia caldariorum TaxID=326644 RepID=UPI0020084775|nr:uncharacterized protein F4812DRAFT_469728 [Daldinia caldariorum]KAI1469602.1 hypothetical protein F4812DRAFT_469728 [Daldinia caldariorum]